MIHIATQMRVRVHVSHLDDPAVHSIYDHDARAIHLSFDLTPEEMRCALAHELIHCQFGDDCSNPMNERRAERLSAALLISPEAYAAAEQLHDHSVDIADELGVTVDVVEAYQDQCLQRLGRRTYGRSPRVGLSGERARQLSS